MFNSFCVEVAESSDGLNGVDQARAAGGNWSILMRILLLTVSVFLRLSRGSRGGLQSRWNKKKPLRADDFVRL